ncbi:hypothetical protein ACFUJT_35090, partial [Streptomyces griseoincarnatus]
MSEVVVGQLEFELPVFRERLSAQVAGHAGERAGRVCGELADVPALQDELGGPAVRGEAIPVRELKKDLGRVERGWSLRAGHHELLCRRKRPGARQRRA